MPDGRRLRGLSGPEVLRAFEKLGCVLARIRGSHYILRAPNNRTFPVPMHGMVKVGTLRNAIRLAGFRVGEFEEALG